MSVMLGKTLNEITSTLSDLRAKVLFGSFGKEEIDAVASYLKQALELAYPESEFFFGNSLGEFKAKASSPLKKHCCLLLDEPFEKKEFPSLVNLAYGNKDITLIGFSSIDSSALDYDRLTTMAGRYDSYYVSPFSFLLPSKDKDFLSLLIEGGSFSKKEQGAFSLFQQTAFAQKARKEKEAEEMVSLFIGQAGRKLSLRGLSSLSSSLAPNTVKRLLDECEARFLIYRLGEIELKGMKESCNSFRLYPADPSVYGFSRREAAEKADLLCLSPLIGRLKEEGYSLRFGYIRERVQTEGGARALRDEEVGVYAKKGRRTMLFALDVSGGGKGAKAIQKASPLFERYLVLSGDSAPRSDSRGVKRIGIESLLSDDFDWEE